jgi:hypothetical protein
MEEYEVIAAIVLHLIVNERAEISKISIQKIEQEQYIKNFLLFHGVDQSVIDNISFKRKEEDIVAHLSWNTGRRQKYLEVEAKGGDTYYNFYTSLGQFICLKKSPSTYYWFAFAFPYYWRREVKKMLTNENGLIKPIVTTIVEKLTKGGQGLWFYFVKEDGTVVKETWKQTLTRD